MNSVYAMIIWNRK